MLASAAQLVANRITEPKVFFFDRVSRGALVLAKQCAAKGALIVFEPAGLGEPKLFKEALSVAHILKYAQERRVTFKEILSTTRPPIEIETLGKAGLRYRSTIDSCYSSNWQTMKAYNVPLLKDAAGAGDWCTAGIIHLLGQDGAVELQTLTLNRLHEALHFGQAMAAWNCGFEGARGGMYKVKELEFRDAVEKIVAGDKMDVLENQSPRVKANRTKKNICPACELRPQHEKLSAD